VAKRRGRCPTLSDDDIRFLRNHYKTLGPSKCARILNRNKSTIKANAKRCGFSTNVTPGHPRKVVVQMINDKRAMMFCKHHGVSEFYIKPCGKPECLACIRQQQRTNHSTAEYRTKKNRWVRKRRSTKLGNYEHRLRTSLRLASLGKLSYSKNLPYTSEELCSHLENIRRNQNNRCPMCGADYDIVGYDIDHVVPISSALSEEQLLRLFDLNNLSILCPTCNRYVKKDRLDISCE